MNGYRAKLNVLIWDLILGMMKDCLQLGEFKFNPDTPDYKFFKSQVMSATYSRAELYFSGSDLFERCSCGSLMKRGRNKDCKECQGSSWKMKETK